MNTDAPTTRIHPARQYLGDLPAVLQDIWIEFRNVRIVARDLLPFVWLDGGEGSGINPPARVLVDLASYAAKLVTRVTSWVAIACTASRTSAGQTAWTVFGAMVAPMFLRAVINTTALRT